MTEVYFRGEYVEESHANLILERESNPNTPEHKRRLEEQTQAKAQADEERKKLQQQKRFETRLKEQKIQEYLQQYHQEFPGQWSEQFGAKQLERAHNSYNYDRDHEQRLKRHEEEQRQMEESIKRRQKEREQMLEVMAKARRRKQLEKTILQEYDMGRIIRLDKQTHDRLAKITKPGETKLDTINRLLDAATAAATK